MITATMPRKRKPGRPRKHGGARPGSGRPPIAPGGAELRPTRFTASQIRKIERWREVYGLDTFSDAVRAMIDAVPSP